MPGAPTIIGNSPLIRDLLARAIRLAAVPRPLLVRGERGTGKELLAELIHLNSAGRAGPLIAVNCAIYGDELLASELFGHEKGAFTGATERRIGCIERADGGTLFLDEIGNMSMGFQEKLLRVIESQRYERIGGRESLTANTRFVSATNADLAAMMDRGEFRADFHDRLAFEVLTLPPLRERKTDVPLLIDHFSRMLIREIPNLEIRTFSDEAAGLMADYYWPGNVRELKNTVERMLLRDGPPVIGTAELPHEITAPGPAGETFAEKVEAYRKHLVLSAWRDCDHNQKRAAEQLGMTYDQFRHYFRKYGFSDLMP